MTSAARRIIELIGATADIATDCKQAHGLDLRLCRGGHIGVIDKEIREHMVSCLVCQEVEQEITRLFEKLREEIQ